MRHGNIATITFPTTTPASEARALIIAALLLPANYSELRAHVYPTENKSAAARIDSDDTMQATLLRYIDALKRARSVTPILKVVDDLVCTLYSKHSMLLTPAI